MGHILYLIGANTNLAIPLQGPMSEHFMLRKGWVVLL
jgi:hypothetical protein